MSSSEARQGFTSNLTTTSGDVTLHMPRLGPETAIIIAAGRAA